MTAALFSELRSQFLLLLFELIELHFDELLMLVPLHGNLGEYDRDNSGEAGKGYRDNVGAS